MGGVHVDELGLEARDSERLVGELHLRSLELGVLQNLPERTNEENLIAGQHEVSYCKPHAGQAVDLVQPHAGATGRHGAVSQLPRPAAVRRGKGWRFSRFVFSHVFRERDSGPAPDSRRRGGPRRR